MKALEITTHGNSVDDSDLLSETSLDHGGYYITANGFTKEKKKSLRDELRNTDFDLVGVFRAHVGCGHYMTKAQGHKLNGIAFEYNALDLAQAINEHLNEDFTHVKVTSVQIYNEYKTLSEKTICLGEHNE